MTVSVDCNPVYTVDASQISDAWGIYTSPVFTVAAGAHTLAFTLGEGDGMDMIDNVVIHHGK